MRIKGCGDQLVKFSLIMMGVCIVPFFVLLSSPDAGNGLGLVILADYGSGLFGSMAVIGAIIAIIGQATNSSATPSIRSKSEMSTQ